MRVVSGVWIKPDCICSTSGAWEHVALPAEVDGKIVQVAKARDSAIWMVTNEHIFRLKGGNLTAFPLQNKLPRAALPLTEWRDRAGNIWPMEIVRESATQGENPFVGEG